MGQHARFAPSAAHRIIDCPASLLIHEKYEDKASREAAEGTVAHWLAEQSLTKNQLPSMHLGRVVEQEGHKITIDAEMVTHVGDYIARVRHEGGEQHFEVRVNISRWTPQADQFGTSDHVSIHPGRLIVSDLKYGKGIKVFAEENYQGILYALGVIDEFDWLYDFDEVVIQIVQPRLDHVDRWVTTKAELLKRGEYILERFRRALEPNPPFGPSEKACKFCNHSGWCKAEDAFINEQAALAFDDLDGEFVYPLEMLSIEEVAQTHRMRNMLKNRISAVEKILMRALNENPEGVPGLKMVEGRSRRAYKSVEEAKRFFGTRLGWAADTYLEEKILSPAKAEKRLPAPLKKELATLLFKPPGKPSIVDASDKRPPYSVSNLEAFEHLDDEDDSE